MAKKASATEKGEVKAFLGPGSRFDGKLMFDEAVRIDGVFAGEVHSKDVLIVGETAEIDAQIHVGVLILCGHFTGSIVATKRVELRAPARVEGSIESPTLVVEEGVLFNGQLVMDQKEKEEKPKEKSSSS